MILFECLNTSSNASTIIKFEIKKKIKKGKFWDKLTAAIVHKPEHPIQEIDNGCEINSICTPN